MLSIRCLLVAIALVPLATAARSDDAVRAKLDAGIDSDSDARYPVLIRFKTQLFKRGGDYEAFAKKHNAEKRNKLRAMVLKTLRGNAASSWKQVGKVVEALEKDDSIRGMQRFWIVNGFACTATYAACKKLAALDEVEFVYYQRTSVRQHKRARRFKPSAARLAGMKKVYRQVLDAWKDDSNDLLKTDGLEIPWNVSRVRADVAWSKEDATGKGVVVALMDSGLMVAPALSRALWRNTKEKLNGKDDDGNGYVDDLFGYDFGADLFYCLGDGARMTHGSMCGGIIAGRPLNSKKLLTGIAPRAKLMMLRGMGLLKSYEYALANGADIVSMSFMFTQQNLGNYRGVYRLAHEHLAAGGVTAVGGAGNFAAGRRALPKGKQIAIPKDIPCVICAAGIVKSGSAPPFSSRGPCSWKGVKFYDDYPEDKPLRKPDVTGCIGGYPVWGRPFTLGGRWKIVSKEGADFALLRGPQGNSFSGPHAAGVAALMLSVNPELNPWEVKRLMVSSCRDIGPKGWDETYGAGLLDAAGAVRAAKSVRK
ncbi:MAG: S8 family serine peptidase [Planctomycetaceae bacterium]